MATSMVASVAPTASMAASSSAVAAPTVAALAASQASAAAPDVDREVQQDEANGGGRATAATSQSRTNEEMMANGGCLVAQVIYENGQDWHPMLPTGEQKCVRCRCKVSESVWLMGICWREHSRT